MKSKEELNTLKNEVENLSKKLAEENKMENKILSDSELEMVNGGWSKDAPASITTCPCCGAMDTGGGMATGRNPLRGLICCHNPKCKLQFEVYLEGELSSTHTGKYYVSDRGEVNLQDYRDELIAKGLI